jgi:hypothetical protein
MFTLFRRLMFGRPRPETRMTEEEVKVLVDKAAQAAHIDRPLAILNVRFINGRLTWIASTATVGSGWSVKIDDTTGEVGPVRRWGIR